jgi:zinc protease
MRALFLLGVGVMMLLANQNLPNAALPWEKSLVRGVLPNGLQYTILKGSRPKHRAELYLYVGIGSLEEEEDQRGVAHFIEHMAFNGTTHFKKNELISYLESLGMSFGGDLNANTNFNRTLYTLSLPLEKDNLDKCFGILKDWAGGLKLDQTEFDKERGVILEEKRLRDTVGYRLLLKTMPIYYGDSRYEKRLTIGLDDVIKHIPIERAKAFYETWYRPEFMHVVAVGDFNTTTVEQQIKAKFSDLLNKSNKPRAPRTLVARHETMVMTVTDKELTRNSVGMIYIGDAPIVKTVHAKKSLLIETIASMLFSLKAQEQILKKNPNAMVIDTGKDLLSSDKMSRIFLATYKNGHAKGALQELSTLMWGFSKYGFSQANFLLAKKLIRSNVAKAQKKIKTTRTDVLARRIVRTIEQDSVYIDYDYDFNMTNQLLDEITLEEVNHFYRALLSLSNRAILFRSSTGKALNREQALAVLEVAKKDAVDMSQDTNLSDSILEEKLLPTKLLSKTYDEKLGIYHYTLENGISVDFKPTDMQKNTLYLKGYSEGGHSVLDDEGFNTIRHAAEWIELSAPGKFTNMELKKMLSGKQVDVLLDIDRFYETIQGTCSSFDTESMFELLYAKVLHPKLDERIFDNGKRQVKNAIEQASKNPRYTFFKRVVEQYFKNNPRLKPESVERVEQLNRMKMLSMYKERFRDMNHFHFVLVGDQKPEEIERLISIYLGNLPSQNREEHYRVNKYAYVPGEQKVVAPFNHEDSASVTLEYRSTLPFSLKNKMLADAVKDILDIRLRNVIREEKSGTYSISISIDMQPELKDALVCSISFTTAPERVAELVEAVKKEIIRIKKEGVSDQEVSVYKQTVLVSFEKALNYNRYWLDTMVVAHQLQIPMQEMMGIPQMLDQVTKEQVKAVASKVFGTDILQAELLPQKK